jgi:hypothetical protein
MSGERTIASPRKGRRKNMRISRLWKFGKSFAGRSRERVKRIRLTLCIDNIVKKCAKGCAGQIGCSVSNDLHCPMQIELRGDDVANLVELFQQRSLIADSFLTFSTRIGQF